ncbi:MAG: hypothetical protein MUD01_12800 [Chloroflexaceae bacterium]|jgi:hypothetical protein|nr:hypothetical protein [Chloroflexaceae bacterium]
MISTDTVEVLTRRPNGKGGYDEAWQPLHALTLPHMPTQQQTAALLAALDEWASDSSSEEDTDWPALRDALDTDRRDAGMELLYNDPRYHS